MMTHTAVRMDKDLKDRLDRLASARRQPAEDIVREAVADYVDRAEKRDAFHQDARHAWERYQRTGLHLTAEEADAWLVRLEAGEDLEPPACHG